MSDMNARAAANRLCGIPGPREELLSATEFDRFELGALEIMRLTFAAMEQNQPRYAPQAEEIAATRFGRARAALIVSGLTAFVQVMAVSRSERFRYSNPFCDGCAAILTQDEANFLRILHHVRRGQRGRAMTHALMLCDARPVGPVLDAAGDLSDMTAGL